MSCARNMIQPKQTTWNVTMIPITRRQGTMSAPVFLNEGKRFTVHLCTASAAPCHAPHSTKRIAAPCHSPPISIVRNRFR